MSEIRYQQVAETGPQGWPRVSPAQRIVEWRQPAGERDACWQHRSRHIERDENDMIYGIDSLLVI